MLMIGWTYLVDTQSLLTNIHTYINNAYYSDFPQLIKALYKTKIDRIKYKAKCKQEIQANIKKEHGTKELEQVRFEFLFEHSISGESPDSKRDFVPQ